jgi:hypothetical protein
VEFYFVVNLFEFIPSRALTKIHFGNASYKCDVVATEINVNLPSIISIILGTWKDLMKWWTLNDNCFITKHENFMKL